MIKRIPALYVYDSDTEELTLATDCIMERLVFSQGTSKEKEHIFAVMPSKKFRIEIIDKSNKVLYTESSHKYTVWMHVPDESMARKLIATYMLANALDAKEKLIKEVALVDEQNRKATRLMGE